MGASHSKKALKTALKKRRMDKPSKGTRRVRGGTKKGSPLKGSGEEAGGSRTGSCSSALSTANTSTASLGPVSIKDSTKNNNNNKRASPAAKKTDPSSSSVKKVLERPKKTVNRSLNESNKQTTRRNVHDRSLDSGLTRSGSPSGSKVSSSPSSTNGASRRGNIPVPIASKRFNSKPSQISNLSSSNIFKKNGKADVKTGTGGTSGRLSSGKFTASVAPVDSPRPLARTRYAFRNNKLSREKDMMKSGESTDSVNSILSEVGGGGNDAVYICDSSAIEYFDESCESVTEEQVLRQNNLRNKANCVKNSSLLLSPPDTSLEGDGESSSGPRSPTTISQASSGVTSASNAITAKLKAQTKRLPQPQLPTVASKFNVESDIPKSYLAKATVKSTTSFPSGFSKNGSDETGPIAAPMTATTLKRVSPTSNLAPCTVTFKALSLRRSTASTPSPTTSGDEAGGDRSSGSFSGSPSIVDSPKDALQKFSNASDSGLGSSTERENQLSTAKVVKSPTDEASSPDDPIKERGGSSESTSPIVEEDLLNTSFVDESDKWLREKKSKMGRANKLQTGTTLKFSSKLLRNASVGGISDCQSKSTVAGRVDLKKSQSLNYKALHQKFTNEPIPSNVKSVLPQHIRPQLSSSNSETSSSSTTRLAVTDIVRPAIIRPTSLVKAPILVTPVSNETVEISAPILKKLEYSEENSSCPSSVMSLRKNSAEDLLMVSSLELQGKGESNASPVKETSQASHHETNSENVIEFNKKINHKTVNLLNSPTKEVCKEAVTCKMQAVVEEPQTSMTTPADSECSFEVLDTPSEGIDLNYPNQDKADGVSGSACFETLSVAPQLYQTNVPPASSQISVDNKLVESLEHSELVNALTESVMNESLDSLRPHVTASTDCHDDNDNRGASEELESYGDESCVTACVTTNPSDYYNITATSVTNSLNASFTNSMVTDTIVSPLIPNSQSSYLFETIPAAQNNNNSKVDNAVYLPTDNANEMTNNNNNNSPPTTTHESNATDTNDINCNIGFKKGEVFSSTQNIDVIVNVKTVTDIERDKNDNEEPCNANYGALFDHNSQQHMIDINRSLMSTSSAFSDTSDGRCTPTFFNADGGMIFNNKEHSASSIANTSTDADQDFLIDDEICDQPDLTFGGRPGSAASNCGSGLRSRRSEVMFSSEGGDLFGLSSLTMLRQTQGLLEEEEVARASLPSETGSITTTPIVTDEDREDEECCASLARLKRPDSVCTLASSLDPDDFMLDFDDNGSLRCVTPTSTCTAGYAGPASLKSITSRSSNSRHSSPHHSSSSTIHASLKRPSNQRNSSGSDVTGRPTRLPRPLPSQSSQSPESMMLDDEVHEQLMEDCQATKSLLLKLRSVLLNADTTNFNNNGEEVDRSLLNGLLTESSSNTGTQQTDLLEQNIDLRKQVCSLQQELQDKERIVQALQQRVTALLHSSSATEPTTDVRGGDKLSVEEQALRLPVYSNAATQTDRILTRTALTPTVGHDGFGPTVSCEETPSLSHDSEHTEASPCGAAKVRSPPPSLLPVIVTTTTSNGEQQHNGHHRSSSPHINSDDRRLRSSSQCSSDGSRCMNGDSMPKTFLERKSMFSPASARSVVHSNKRLPSPRRNRNSSPARSRHNSSNISSSSKHIAGRSRAASARSPSKVS